MAELSLGSKLRIVNVVSYCASVGGSLGGGTSCSWSDSPERRGNPWAPPPRGVLLKAVLSYVFVILLGIGILFGKCKKVCCFGSSVQFRLPLVSAM